MAFNTGAALLDALVLSVVGRESTYGYKITQDVRGVIDVSESTLYPVLRRLQKDECLDPVLRRLQKDGYLTTFDREHAGRNRRYYQITDAGRRQLAAYRTEWAEYCRRVDSLLYGEEEA